MEIKDQYSYGQWVDNVVWSLIVSTYVLGFCWFKQIFQGEWLLIPITDNLARALEDQ